MPPLFALTTTTIGVIGLVIIAAGWIIYGLFNIVAGRREVGSEIELAANRKEYYDDETLEGPRLERLQLLGLLLLLVSVIGLPVYNFGVPASFKAWIDQITRVGETFAYSENGPQGKLTGKKVIVAVAAGGTKVGSDYDFATGYVTHILGFMGIKDVTFVAADQVAIDAETSVQSANDAVAALDVAA